MYTTGPDFDNLLKWAQEEPEKLDTYLKTEVEKIITSAPEAIQGRLRGLQFQIDSQRRIHSNPLARCIQISKMMHESLNKLTQAIQGYQEEGRAPAVSRADVLKFPAEAAS